MRDISAELEKCTRPVVGADLEAVNYCALPVPVLQQYTGSASHLEIPEGGIAITRTS